MVLQVDLIPLICLP